MLLKIFATIITLITLSAAEQQFGFATGETAEGIFINSLLYRVETTNQLEAFGIPLSRYNLNAYQDFSAFQFNFEGDQIYGGSTTVTIGKQFDSLQFAGFTPVIEVSTGVAILADVEIGPLDFGSAFQFQHQLSGGLRTKRFDLFFNAAHISNAGITRPNDGADILSFSVRYRF